MISVPFGADYDDEGNRLDAVDAYDQAHGDPDVPWPPETGAASPARPFSEISLADLIRQGVPPPELLCGDLLYAGGLHSISGPPDCGKTTIAMHWLLQHARAGNDVVFLDEEGGGELVAEKLIALDATPEEAERIRYFPFPRGAGLPTT